jgi:hypothetical protein
MHLPETGAYAELSQILDDYEDRGALATDKAFKTVEREIHGLSVPELDNFEHALFIKNMAENVEIWQKEADEAGISAADFEAGFDDTQRLPVPLAALKDAEKALGPILKAHPEIEQQMEKVRALRKEVIDPYKAELKATWGRDPELDRDWYLRQIYDDLQGGGGGTGGGGKPGQSAKTISPLKKRVGSAELFSTNFVKAELDMIHRIAKHHAELRLTRYIMENLDRMPALKMAKALCDTRISPPRSKLPSILARPPPISWPRSGRSLRKEWRPTR